MKPKLFLVVPLLCAFVSGCSSRIVERDNEAPPAIRINDGSLCEAPAGFSALVQSAGTRQVRSLFLASASPQEIVSMVSELPGNDELSAAFYLSCEEWARGELSRAVFSHQRRVYQEFRLARMSQGIEQWREVEGGFEMPGKICHFIFDGTNPDERNITRMVPKDTTVDDCALYVFDNGGTHLRLGCSAGRWKTQWAEQPLLVGPNGWANRRLQASGTQYVPQSNCGWQ